MCCSTKAELEQAATGAVSGAAAAGAGAGMDCSQPFGRLNSTSSARVCVDLRPQTSKTCINELNWATACALSSACICEKSSVFTIFTICLCSADVRDEIIVQRIVYLTSPNLHTNAKHLHLTTPLDLSQSPYLQNHCLSGN